MKSAKNTSNPYRSLGLGLPYRPLSTAYSLQVETPDSMATEMTQSLQLLKTVLGDVDDFLCQKLRYASKTDLFKAFAAEQIDAIALAIYNIEYKAQGLIIGDQTGVGKGRVAAGLIRYAVAQGLRPIFITEKPNLFSDIYRDLIDIGLEDASQPLKIKLSESQRSIRYKAYSKLSEAEIELYGTESEYLAFQKENPFETVVAYQENQAYNPKKGSHVIPYILNARDPATEIKDSEGNILYQAADAQVQKKVMEKMALPPGYDLLMLTYSQIQNGNKLTLTGIELSAKARLIQKLAHGNLVILDESHNASGESARGLALQQILKNANVAFLSATFAKRPDNMPIYAMKTAIAEANLSSVELSEAIDRGGVALQEIISAQLVSQGQMIRRERTFEGIQVNYFTLDENGAKDVPAQDPYEALFQAHYCTAQNAKADQEKSDAVTAVIRAIVDFQEKYVLPEVKTLDKIASSSQGEVALRKGTKEAGVDSTPYFSKLFNVFNQLLFAIKAEAVADRAIMRLKQGKKPIIAFSSTMGSFLESIDAEAGESEGLINADFTTVLLKGLKGVLRYTEIQANGDRVYKAFDIMDFSQEAIAEYYAIESMIKSTSSGVVLSPIDLIKKRIQEAGFSIAEVTGRKLALNLEQKPMLQKDAALLMKTGNLSTTKKLRSTASIPSIVKKMMPTLQQKKLSSALEVNIPTLLALEQQIKEIPPIGYYLNAFRAAQAKNMAVYPKDFFKSHLHFSSSDTDWYIAEYDGNDMMYGYSIQNQDDETGEFGYISLAEILEEFQDEGIELALNDSVKSLREALSAKGLGKRKAKGLGKIEPEKATLRWIGSITKRPKENVSDAFRRFNDNEVDVLLINQSGSTGASAHAIATKKVAPHQVRQRVMIVLQAELDINTEVQKRGRINRTGQILKPIYDYVTSAIPAEKRLMMMLQKKLKSLDANTASNQRNSESILKSEDFLNKYGNEVVAEYLKENQKINLRLGDPLHLVGLSDSDKVQKNDKAAEKVTGRVALLTCRDQEQFYQEVLDLYRTAVEIKLEAGEYDLEVEVTDLKAVTLEKKVLIEGKGGNSPFSTSTFEELCEVNELKKPYTAEELRKIMERELQGLSTEKYAQELILLSEQKLSQIRDEKIKDIAEVYRVKKERVSQRKDIKAITDLEKRQVASQKLILELEETQRKAQDYEREKSKKQFDYFKNQIFSFFQVGSIIYLPEVENAPMEGSTLGIFMGFQINQKKENPFTPGNIKLKFAIASGKRSRTFNLSGDGIRWVNAIKSISRTGVVNREMNLRKWEEAVKVNYAERTKRYLLTGNLLQAFGNANLNQYQLKLIEYTTLKGEVLKGILMPDVYKNASSNKSALAKSSYATTIPIAKALKVLQGMPSREILLTNMGMSFQHYQGDYLCLVPANKQKAGDIYLDPDLRKWVEGNEFIKQSNVFKAKVSQHNLQNFLTVLQNNHSLSLIVPNSILEMVKYDFTDVVAVYKKTTPITQKLPLATQLMAFKLSLWQL